MPDARPRTLRWLPTAVLLTTVACNGGISCGGCIPGGVLAPIPGGFDRAEQIEGLIQARVSPTGLRFFEQRFADLAGAYAGMSCGGPDDVACPTAYGTTCDPLRGRCVNAMGNSEPVLGFAIDRAEQSGATVCRDPLTDPNRRACAAWLRLEGLGLAPRAPNLVEATVSARVVTTPIPFRYDALGMDCLVTLDSARSGSPAQDFVLTAELGQWSGGQQLEVRITELVANIANDDIRIERDPVFGNAGDLITCGISNIGAVKNILVDRLTGQLASIIDSEVRELLGWRCGRPGDTACPMGATCSATGFCEEGGVIVPQVLGAEGRLDLAGLLPGLVGAADVSFVVGGTARADAQGATVGVLGGVTLPTPPAACVMPTPHPRQRPGFAPPRAFPTDPSIDLDFDGTPDPFMLGAGISQSVLDHLGWAVHNTGLLCTSISTETSPLVNTGSFSVLMPSLRQLTHSDRDASNVFPARVDVRPGGEPRVRIGLGRNGGTPGMPTLIEPLVTLELDDLELYFSGMVEERWVHLMTVTLDVAVPVGLIATPANGFEIVIGDVEAGLTDVRVRDARILAETAMDLEDTVPALVSIVLPQITQFLQLPLALPGPADLGGFDVTIKGLRGVPDGMGGYDFIGAFLDLDFDPALAPRLAPSVETEAWVSDLALPSSEAMDVSAPGVPVRPVLTLALASQGPAGRPIEHQLRIDGGRWGPFFRGDEVRLDRAELLLQGRHRIEVRARLADDYRTLDPSPAVVDVVIDTEPPVLHARLRAAEGAIELSARDVVHGDAVRLELAVDGRWRDVSPDVEAWVAVPELADPAAGIEVRASDPSGNVVSRVLRAAGARELAAGSTLGDELAGCSAALPSSADRGLALLGLVGLLALRRRRRA